MSVRPPFGGLLLVAFGAATLALPAPALAHHKPGHAQGPGSNCATPSKPYPPKQCSGQQASVSDSTVQPGQRSTFTASGFSPRTPVKIMMYSTPVTLGTVTADEFAFVSLPFTVPATAQTGAHDLVATGEGADGRELRLVVPITVGTGAAVAVSAPKVTAEPELLGMSLPQGSGEILLAGALGAGLLTAGGAAFASGRRRRSA